jgi:hypothetical protein
MHQEIRNAVSIMLQAVCEFLIDTRMVVESVAFHGISRFSARFRQATIVMDDRRAPTIPSISIGFLGATGKII